MAKSKQTFNKREREKKRQKKKQEKQERRAQRKAEKAEGLNTNEDNFSYVDEDGNLTSTPPDPKKKKKIKAEDIIIGIPSKEDIPEEKVKSGKVKFFNYEKEYGFIAESTTGDSYFVHISDCLQPINENDKVTFEVETGPKGLKAVKVNLV